MCVFFGLLLGRLAQLSILHHRNYLERSIYARLRQIIYPAPRGNIFDRDGFLLASDRQTLDLQIVLSEFNSEVGLLARRISRAAKTPLSGLQQTLRALADRQALGEPPGETLVAQDLSPKAASSLRGAPALLLREKNPSHSDDGRAATYDLYVDPAQAFPMRSHCVASLASLLGLSRSQVLEERIQFVQQRVEHTSWLVDYVALPLFRDVSFDTVARVETDSGNFIGIVPSKGFRREYAQGKLAAHVLGYVSLPSEEDLERIRKYQVEQIRPLWKFVEETAPLVGRSGVEAYYDDLLQGRAGTALVEVDVRNRLQRYILTQPPLPPALPGEDLHLTISTTYQEAAEKALEGKKGAIVLMDPWNGELLAIASSPGFDPNDLVPPVSSKSYDKYVKKNSGSPFLNRATMGCYPLASVFKILVAIAGLEEPGIITPSTSFNCTGYLNPGSHSFPCWNIYGHGEVTVREAIENSCNIFFYRTGLLLRPERMAKWANDFGYGSLTGIDLPQGAPGVIPTPEWKRDETNPPEGWYKADTLNTSIGQGYVLVTPLQSAVMMAAVANGGVVVAPHLNKDDTRHEKRVLTISPETLSLVRGGLEDVVDSGTAQNSGMKDFDAAGKTGTAQVTDQEPHAWFVGYAPRKHPQVVISVLIENGGSGGEIAAPIAAEILATVFPPEG